VAKLYYYYYKYYYAVFNAPCIGRLDDEIAGLNHETSVASPYPT